VVFGSESAVLAGVGCADVRTGVVIGVVDVDAKAGVEVDDTA
jgi:hypothetical protein